MPKIHPADAEAAEYLERQKSSAADRRISDTLLLCLLSAIILVFGVLIFTLPHKSFSENENRALASFPEFSLKSLSDGSFTQKIGDFYSDQFPAREFFVKVKAISELAQLKMQNNGVIPGSDGNLIKRLEYSDYDALKANLGAVSDFRDALTTDGIDVVLAIPPRSVDVLTDALPPLFSGERTSRVWEIAGEYDTDADMLLKIMKNAANDGEYVYYRTDHHWTTDGAYLAYAALGEKLGYTPMPREFFTKELVSDSFYGTTYSSSGIYWTDPDEMYFYRFDGDENYIVENLLTKKSMQGFYDTSYLTAKDKYSAFLGGNQAYLKVYDPTSTEKPTLVIVKDSFAHSLAPFLAIHFDLEIIDLRYYVGSVADVARENNATAVLVLVGADDLANSDTLTLLRYGMTKKAD